LGERGDSLRILIISQYFWPESFRINDVVKSLSEKKSIDVLTGKLNYPDGELFSLLNGFLYFISFRLAYLCGNSIFLAVIKVITNYYLLALFFTLEKLKIAIIFLLMGLYYVKNNNKVIGVLFLLIAPLAHLQIIIFYVSHLFSQNI